MVVREAVTAVIVPKETGRRAIERTTSNPEGKAVVRGSDGINVQINEKNEHGK